MGGGLKMKFSERNITFPRPIVSIRFDSRKNSIIEVELITKALNFVNIKTTAVVFLSVQHVVESYTQFGIEHAVEH